MTYDECVALIEKAAKDGATELDLSRKGLEKLPPEIGRLNQPTALNPGSRRYRLILFENRIELGDQCNCRGALEWGRSIR